MAQQLVRKFQAHAIIRYFYLYFICRRPRHIFKLNKQHGTRDHVLLLHGIRHGTRVPEVSVVEETSHPFTIGKYRNTYITLSRARERVIISILSLFQLQFTLVFIHSAQALFVDCGYPKIVAAFLLFHSVVFFALFSNFYYQTYKARERAQALKKEQSNQINNYQEQ